MKTDQQLQDEKQLVAAAMQRYGGSFYGSLGAALARADWTNTRKIHDTWPDRWRLYLEMHQQAVGQGNP